MTSTIQRWRFLAIALVALGCSETTATSLPNPPDGVTASLVNRTAVAVSWNARPSSEKIASYGVYRDGRKIGETEGPTFTDASPPELQTHSYAVASQSADGIISELSAGATVFAPDATSPRVLATDPITNSINIVPSPTIRVVFSEPLDAATVPSALTMKSATTGAVIPGVSTYTASTNAIQWQPNASIEGETRVVATVATSVRDTAGNALRDPFTFGFTIQETVPPRLLGFTPADGSTGVSLYSKIVLTFSEPMKNFCCVSMVEVGTNNGQTAAASFDATRTVATLNPCCTVKPNTTYRLTLFNQAVDMVGNKLVDPFTMSISYADDFVLPKAVSTSPGDGATGVSPNTPTFTVNLDRMLIGVAGYQASFVLRTVDGTVLSGGSSANNYYSTTLTYRAPQLSANTRYIVTLTQRYTPSGAPAAEDVFSWSFTTGQ